MRLWRNGRCWAVWMKRTWPRERRLTYWLFDWHTLMADSSEKVTWRQKFKKSSKFNWCTKRIKIMQSKMYSFPLLNSPISMFQSLLVSHFRLLWGPRRAFYGSVRVNLRSSQRTMNCIKADWTWFTTNRSSKFLCRGLGWFNTLSSRKSSRSVRQRALPSTSSSTKGCNT